MQHRNDREPEEVIFDANLQEFATKVGFICALESNEKITAHEAYRRIKKLYKSLKKSRRGLQIGRNGSEAESDPGSGESEDE